jgi:hypothetical protein
MQPEIEIPRVFGIINQNYKNSVFTSMNKPSATTINSSSIVTGADKISNWQDKFSSSQIKNILSIVEKFGLYHIYGDLPVPYECATDQ